MPEFRVSHAGAHLGTDARADAHANAWADTIAVACTNDIANAEPDEYSNQGTYTKPDTCAHLFPDGATDATAAHRLRDERVWDIYPVLEDVRRWHAVAYEIHRDGASARRPGVWQFL